MASTGPSIRDNRHSPTENTSNDIISASAATAAAAAWAVSEEDVDFSETCSGMNGDDESLVDDNDYSGVLLPNETPEMQTLALKHLQDAIDLIPKADKVDYLKAKRICPHLFKTESDPMMFLRCDNFNAWAAARRLVEYWRYRTHVFGETRAFHPMEIETQGAFDEEDIPYFKVAKCFVLPPSSNGLTAAFFDRSLFSHAKLDCGTMSEERMSRVIFFGLTNLAMRTAKQNGGVRFILVRGNRRFRAGFLANTKWCVRRALPIKFKKVHFVLNQPQSKGLGEMFLKKMIPIVLKRAGGFFREHAVIHFAASPSELLHELELHGFEKASLPVSLGGTYEVTQNRPLLDDDDRSSFLAARSQTESKNSSTPVHAYVQDQSLLAEENAPFSAPSSHSLEGSSVSRSDAARKSPEIVQHSSRASNKQQSPPKKKKSSVKHTIEHRYKSTVSERNKSETDDETTRPSQEVVSRTSSQQQDTSMTSCPTNTAIGSPSSETELRRLLLQSEIARSKADIEAMVRARPELLLSLQRSNNRARGSSHAGNISADSVNQLLLSSQGSETAGAMRNNTLNNGFEKLLFLQNAARTRQLAARSAIVTATLAQQQSQCLPPLQNVIAANNLSYALLNPQSGSTTNASIVVPPINPRPSIVHRPAPAVVSARSPPNMIPPQASPALAPLSQLPPPPPPTTTTPPQTLAAVSETTNCQPPASAAAGFQGISSTVRLRVADYWRKVQDRSSS